MQQRHKDRKLYFNELANTSRKYYVPLVERLVPTGANTRVLEIGCGEGGNLLPFAEQGCQVTGIDINEKQIERANLFFNETCQKGNFIASDFFLVPSPSAEEERFDIVLIHDVIEHIEAPDKERFFNHMRLFMRHGAIAFMAFPAWQMPFGGHQQICTHALSKIPFVHLLPTRAYRLLLKITGETTPTIECLMSIKRSRMPIEKFERLTKSTDMCILHRTLWLINPHYHQKFGLRPLREAWPFNKITFFRNFYTTSAWFILR